MTYPHTETDLPIENEYPKLVRDRIPEMIEEQGGTAVTHGANDQEYLELLFLKLREEATELKEAESRDHQKEELADIKEVVAAIQTALGLSNHEVNDTRARKRAERGGFAARIVMDEKPSI